MAEIASWNGRLLSTAPSMNDATVGSTSACRCSRNALAMNAWRRGQVACLSATTSSISTMRAGGKAPGNDGGARAAKARPRACRARGKGGRGRVVEVEVAFNIAIRPAAVTEPQHMMVFQLVDERWIMDLNE